MAETFLVAWRRLDDLPPEPLPWLIGVARNARLNARRSRRRGSALVERLAREPAPPPPLLDDDHEELRRALAALPERDREVLLLVAWDGLDRDEIAAALGCTRTNVAVRLHRARRRLARALDGEGRTTTLGGVTDVCS